MFNQTQSVFSIVILLCGVILGGATTVDAQAGYFQGHFVGLGDASGAAITLTQRGEHLEGRLLIDGASFLVEASVSGTSGYGIAGDPQSGAVQPFGLNLVNGGLVVTVPQPSSGAQIFRFQRRNGSAEAPSAPERPKRRYIEDEIADGCIAIGGCPF